VLGNLKKVIIFDEQCGELRKRHTAWNRGSMKTMAILCCPRRMQLLAGISTGLFVINKAP
jgi:hypothetical protein